MLSFRLSGQQPNRRYRPSATRHHHQSINIPMLRPNRSSSLIRAISSRRCSMASFVNCPCFHCPLRGPRGAPALPPCIRQRLRPRTQGFAHGLPARVFAPHRSPGQFGPNWVSSDLGVIELPCMGLMRSTKLRGLNEVLLYPTTLLRSMSATVLIPRPGSSYSGAPLCILVFFGLFSSISGIVWPAARVAWNCIATRYQGSESNCFSLSYRTRLLSIRRARTDRSSPSSISIAASSNASSP